MAIAIVRSDAEPQSQINMTPLIDVMLVLLIIFIITIPIQTNAIKIENPSVKLASSAVVPQPIDVAIDFDGMVTLNGQVVDRAMLQSDAARYAEMTPQPVVRIDVDKFAKYEVVAQTLADLQSRGLKSVGFVNR